MPLIFTGGVNLIGAVQATGAGYTPPPLPSAKALFGYGTVSYPTLTAITNLVSNTGVVSSDVTGVGGARSLLAAAGFGS